MIEDQPLSVPNRNPSISDMVIQDINDRKQVGINRYGTPLQAFNGRKPLIDLYQELMDAIVYCRQQIEEQKVLIELVDEVLLAAEEDDPEVGKRFGMAIARLMDKRFEMKALEEKAIRNG